MKSSVRHVAVILLALVAGPMRPLEARAQAVATPVDREVKIAEQAFTRDAQTPAWVEQVAIPDITPKGPVTAALYDTQIHVGTPVVTYIRQAARVNDQVALSAAGRVGIGFVPDYQRVVLHTLRIWRNGVAQDQMPTVDVRFLQRENGLEKNLYSGVVTASMLIDDVRVGDIVEFAYSLVGTNPVFGERYAGFADWDQGWPVALRRVTLQTPTSRTVAWKAQGGSSRAIAKPQEAVRNGMRILTFEERNLEPIKPEAQVPNGYMLARWLQFSEFASWNEVATWATSLFDAPEPPDPARAALIAQFKALPTEEERAVAALEPDPAVRARRTATRPTSPPAASPRTRKTAASDRARTRSAPAPRA